MLKKSFIVVGAVLLVLVLLFGPSLKYKGQTAWNWLHESVSDSVPIEFQLEEARAMVKDLDKDVRQTYHDIAKEEVLVENLDSDVAALEQSQMKSKEDMFRLKTDLETGSTHFTYVNGEFNREQVSTELRERLNNHKTNDETLSHLRSTLKVRQGNLTAARDHLKQLQSQQKELALLVDQLEAQHKKTQVAKAASKRSYDDSHLTRTRDKIEDLKMKIETEARMINAETRMSEHIQLDPPAGAESGSVVEDVADYFKLESADTKDSNPRLTHKIQVQD